MPQLTQRDFERLLEFRATLRRFQRWSEDQAQAAGLTQVQHQLLVAIKGHPAGAPPTVGELAGYLLLRPHSTVELVDRAESAGLVERMPDQDDGRVVRVRLTGQGDRKLRADENIRAHRLRGCVHWPLAWPLLWLVISVALISVGLAVSHGGGGTCAMRASSCARYTVG